MIVIDMNMPTDCVDCWINCQTDTCPIKCDIEDIKAEIYKERTNISFNMSEEKSKWVNSGIYDGLVWAEEIIDKHIRAEMESEE